MPTTLFCFLGKKNTEKYKNKLIILDNASSHRNHRIKDLVNKHNNILYAVPYQHFTNSIENYFVEITITKIRWVNACKTKGKYRTCYKPYTKG